MMRRLIGGAIAVAAVALLLSRPGLAERVDAQGDSDQHDAADATATRRAELLDLGQMQTRVAELSTEVANKMSDPLSGRLGGSRESFIRAYGNPTQYLADDQVAFSVAGFGQVIVTFGADKARRIFLTPLRPADVPSTVADPADWSIPGAREAARMFLPADVQVRDAPADAAVQRYAVQGWSSALAATTTDATGDACPDGHVPPSQLQYRWTMPTEHSVSMITIEIGTGEDEFSSGQTADVGATEPQETDLTPVPETVVPSVADSARPNGTVAPETGSAPLESSGSNGGNGARVSVSGGRGSTVSANGIRVRLLQLQRDALPDGTGSPPAGQGYVALEVTLENQSREPLRYQPSDFRLAMTDGTESQAICSGPSPLIARGELAVGATKRGWISFAVSDGAEPRQFTYIVRPGVTISFRLG